MAKSRPELVEAAGNVPHLIGKELLGVAEDIFDNPAPLDTRDDVFDQDAHA